MPLKCLPSARGPPGHHLETNNDHGEAPAWQCHSPPIVAGNVLAFGGGDRLALTTHDPRDDDGDPVPR